MNTVDLAAIQTGEESGSISTWRDWVGIVASIGCAIHCAAMPFVIAYLPALGLSFLADEAFHKWMALICFIIAIAAFVPGIRKHGNWVPISIGGAGLVLITFAAFGLAGECCASCKTDSATAGAACSDEGCEHCEDCQTESSDGQSSSGTEALLADKKEKDWLATIAPWITPFGGLMLVSAHLLNRRYGCLCGCCGPNLDSKISEKAVIDA